MLRRGIGRVGRPGLIGTMARTAVVAGTATAVAGGVSRRQQARAQQAADAEAWQQQQAMAAQQAQAEQFAAQQAAAAPPAAPADLVTQLKELAALREQGILTEEEFAVQKARILQT
jgi:hypothetical protein